MQNRRQLLLNAYKLFDVLVMLGCFALASWISFSLQNGDISFHEFISMRIKIQNFALLIGFVYLWHAILHTSNLYQTRRLGSRWREIKDIMKATAVGSFGLWCMAALFTMEMVNDLFIALFWSFCTAIMISSRLVLRRVLELLRLRGRNLRFMLIAGTNQRAVGFARKIESKPELGYRVAGFVDSTWDGLSEFRKNGYNIVADFDDLPSYLRQNVIDEILICLPLNSLYSSASSIATLCAEQGIIIRYLQAIFELDNSFTTTDYFEGEPLITNRTGALVGWQVIIKRFIDIVISGILLIVLTPLFLAIAIMVKMTSPGPVFFVQERVGLNKRRFHLYKFRTMVKDAEQKQSEMEEFNEMTGPVFKIANDPRINPLGRFLRKTSIDELPQLINVLGGDMSLVGPRPLPVRDYECFEHDWHRRRFSVRPGITCLWQISGRNLLPFEKWIELDMKYIDNWSLWLDLKIMLKTIHTVFTGTGAV
jgi:exopolysaccharide biosynthesis polyprenyl glycosylphosphotransferase